MACALRTRSKQNEEVAFLLGYIKVTVIPKFIKASPQDLKFKQANRFIGKRFTLNNLDFKINRF